MTEAGALDLPLWALPLLLLPPLILLGAAVVGLRRLVRRQSQPGEERDWSVPTLTDGAGASPFHQWEVRCKLLTLLLYSFLIAALHRPAPALIAVGLSILALMLAKTPLLRALTRILAITGFLSMLLVVIPFSAPAHPGDQVVMFGNLTWLCFNMRGLVLAITIAAKATAIALLMEPLLSTAPLPVTLYGLSRLGVPDMAGQMVLLSHRYIHVFRHEARRMADGMQVRGFRKRTDLETLKAVANFLGMLFVRSFERTERVFDAMQARGYTGRFPAPADLPIRPRDLWTAGGWLAVGVALLLLDRLGS